MNAQELFSKIRLQADSLSLRHVRRKSLQLGIRNEKPDSFYQSEDEGVMIEVLLGGAFGYAATNDLRASSLQKAAEIAYQWALAAKAHKLFTFDTSTRPSVKGKYVSPCKQNLSQFRLQESSALLSELSQAMNQRPEIISRRAGLMVYDLDTQIYSSHGVDISQQMIYSSVGVSAVASQEGQTQTRSWGWDLNHQYGLEKLDRAILLPEAQRVAREAYELLSAEECPNETMDLLLAPDQMFLQIHESIGHPLELDRILGDERNYAGWSFVKPEDFGRMQYGSALMNVTFDPSLVGENASYAFDDTANPARREFLIENGVLKRGLGSLESQSRLQVPGVASQRATSWNRAPIDRMANINLEPGDSSLGEMIASVERGIYMLSNKSWSIDDYRNKFQFGCEYAKLIENGRLTKTVKNPNYRSITTPFWNSLKMLGDKSTFEVGGLNNCGKGEPNQVIFVGHASPVCLFGNIEVFGGGKT